jgi:hypothetical protein
MPSTVAPIVTPATWEAEIGKILILGQLGQKVSETLIISTNNPSMVGCTCHPSYLKSISRRITGEYKRPYVTSN